MKRFTALVLVLIFLLSLTACGGKVTTSGQLAVDTLPAPESTDPAASAPEPEASTLPSEPEETSEPQPDDPLAQLEGLVAESFSDAGEYEVVYDEDYSNLYYYSYHLPMLTASDEGAQAINNAIALSFGALIQNQYQSMDDGKDIGYNIVSWYPSVCRDLVILVLSAESNFGDTAYGVYCYDRTAGQWLQGSELLDYLYIGEEEFLEATRQAAEECYLSLYGDIPEEDREIYGYYSQLAWTVSDENINFDNLLFYPDQDGSLVVLAPIGSLAGASWYYHYLYPEISYG